MSTPSRAPSEICWEARGLFEVHDLDPIEYPVSARVLEALRGVVASLTPSDRLVDLYSNTGNGDVLLVASALDAQARSESTLWPDQCSIATDDQGLTRKAEQFGLQVIGAQAFVALVAAASG